MNETEPLFRVLALHALGYCERVFHLEEVEEIRTADAAVHAGRRLHEEILTDEGGGSLPVVSSEMPKGVEH